MSHPRTYKSFPWKSMGWATSYGERGREVCMGVELWAGDYFQETPGVQEWVRSKL